MSQPATDQRERERIAERLRTEARTLCFHIGRYHDEQAVDARYQRAAGLMEEAAEALNRNPLVEAIALFAEDSAIAYGKNSGRYPGDVIAEHFNLAVSGDSGQA
jgi:hypothetical protein